MTHRINEEKLKSRAADIGLALDKIQYYAELFG